MKYSLVIMTTILLASTTVVSGTSTDIQNAVTLERTKGAIYGLKIYKSLIDKNPSNLVALQKGTLAAARLVQLQKTKAMQRSFAALSYKYALMAYKLNPMSAQNNYLMALSKGLVGMYVPLTEKVRYAQDIEKYAKKTIQLNPRHPYVYHLIGRLYYEMASISNVEMKIATAIYRDLPKGTYKKALEYMKKCYTINPNFIVNLSDMGLVYHKLNQDTQAKIFLKKAIATKPYYVEDKHVIKEAQDLMNVIN